MASKMPIFQKSLLLVLFVLLSLEQQFYTAQKALDSQTKAKKTAQKKKNCDLKSMNNTKANGLQNAHFSEISVPGLICDIEIPSTALYSLEGP